ncbi:sensor histidine kinase [Colwellia piezophila]|uniref:sensor histidine kinase n=1 Tax=Colwellia piezophila TaxID=211668 RepID=UPI0003615A64|nr:HAMP domain-containing sensor histidine kinase [Colwellia piezophila]
MAKTNKVVSLHSRFIQCIMALTAIILFITSLCIIYLVDKQANQTIANETRVWANILAKISTPFLEENDDVSHIKVTKLLNMELKQAIITPIINRIYVYSLNKTGSIEYFTSYKKNYNFPPASNKPPETSQLNNIQYQENHLELVVEIKKAEQVLGYLLIQSSLIDKQNFIQKLIFIMIILLISSLLIAFVFSQWLFKTTTNPMLNLIEDINKISQSRNYQTTLAKQPYKELEHLSKSINVLLLRTEKHINNFIEEHQHDQSQNQALENRLSARTNALKESNQELLSTLEKLHEFQGQLVETEKMASLGDMVAGIAHEVNTPIGLGVTASSLLADKLSEIQIAFTEKTLKSSQLKKFLTDGDENIAIILRNLERAAKLISSFKKVAVDQSSAESRTFNVRGLVDEVLLTLSAKLKSNNVTVCVECPDDLYINSKPGPINQILINLILNSIHHAFDGVDNAIITISIMNLSDQLHINYSDNGTGIDESMKSKIFDPFTTTKRGSGGSGLGMHLVFNLVTQALDGYITLENENKPGASFDITFPVELAAS